MRIKLSSSKIKIQFLFFPLRETGFREDRYSSIRPLYGLMTYVPLKHEENIVCMLIVLDDTVQN